jgi:spore coat-associated protein N
MSRTKVLRANPRRLLAALATILVAVGVTVASGATFTATSANTANTFSSGTMTLGNSNSGAILTASGLKPAGPTQSGEVQIQNTGSLAGAITLKTTNLVDSTPAMAGNLDLTIDDCGTDLNCTLGTSTNVYTGKLNAMPTKSLSTWAAAEQHRYKFTVGLDSAADNTLQGKTTSVAFQWDAA